MKKSRKYTHAINEHNKALRPHWDAQIDNKKHVTLRLNFWGNSNPSHAKKRVQTMIVQDV